MGRRHLSRGALAALGLALALVPSGGAATQLRWRLIASGAAAAQATAPMDGHAALTKRAAKPIAARLPAAAAARLAKVDFARKAVLGVFGRFGCKDGLISVVGVERTGPDFVVRLRQRPPPPGTAQCQAIFETFRLLTVDKSSLRRPYPTKLVVTLDVRS